MAFSCEAGVVQSTDLHTALGVGAGRGPRGHEPQATGLPYAEALAQPNCLPWPILVSHTLSPEGHSGLFLGLFALNFWEEGENEPTSGSLLGVNQSRQTSRRPTEAPCPQESRESGLHPFHT